jgi:hypothetical protein
MEFRGYPFALFFHVNQRQAWLQNDNYHKNHMSVILDVDSTVGVCVEELKSNDQSLIVVT